MTFLHADLKTPWGPIATIARGEDDVIVGAMFGALPELISRMGSSLVDIEIRTVRALGRTSDAVSHWLDGDANAFDALTVVQPGSDFFQKCWAVLRSIPRGEVLTYAELAASAGSPKAVRAAGSACANNLIAPFVPCHRVVRTNGEVGHYGFGSDLKYNLLVHEGVEFE